MFASDGTTARGRRPLAHRFRLLFRRPRCSNNTRGIPQDPERARRAGVSTNVRVSVVVGHCLAATFEQPATRDAAIAALDARQAPS
ncbi:MAG: hypothetical protein M3O70_04560 [Actinomycetota bacterium]|nr:hypothetical protein [Actinomycetota bacterium]